jgi:hypothetical protein
MIGRRQGGERESSSTQAVAGRRGPRHRRVRGYAGRYSGIGGRHDPPSRKQCEQRIFVGSQLTSVEFPFLGARDMYVPFLLFVIAIVLILIFWELSKINGRLKKALVAPHDTVKGNKDTQS